MHNGKLAVVCHEGTEKHTMLYRLIENNIVPLAVEHCSTPGGDTEGQAFENKP
jgi:hypothetical protein